MDRSVEQFDSVGNVVRGNDTLDWAVVVELDSVAFTDPFECLYDLSPRQPSED